MPSRAELAAIAFIAATSLSAFGCALGTSQAIQVGAHRVRLLTPAGWEHLDHGRWQIFRRGEMQITLADFGPAVLDSLAPRADSAAFVLERVLDSSDPSRRREIKRQAHRMVDGVDWLEVETWDRVSHLSVRKLAVADDAGELLLLRMERGSAAVMAEAYETILSSIVMLPRRPAAPVQ